MDMTITTTAAVWDMLAERWRKTIKAKALAANTERGYLYTARRWSAWLIEQGLAIEPAEVRAHHVDDFIADIIEATSAANGAHHYRNLRVYFAWLVKRKEITTGNPMAETEPPTVPDKLIPVLTDKEHTSLLATCAGKDFLSMRDTAILLLFIDTGLRVSELGQLRRNHIELTRRQFKVIGKGNRERWVGFSNTTGLVLARYLKQRDQRAGADSAALWLNRWGRPLSVDGIKNMLTRRGQQAGIEGTVHAHRFRHDFSHRWKLAGGSDEGLMTIGGWASPKMVQHYGRAARTQRALAEQDRLALADRVS
jgi:site-specific recombinase XerD